MRGISLGFAAGASAAALVTLGCAIGAGGGGAAPDATSPPVPIASVFVLEATGAIPDDTSVAVGAGASRVIELRRSGPDYGLFARLIIPPPDSGSAPGGPLQVTLRPRPGLYAIDLEIEGRIAPGAVIEFSYGMHFVAPAGARERYGGDLEFARALLVARQEGDSQVVFLPTRRPGSDMVRAPIERSGRYLVAAPRNPIAPAR